MKKYKRFWKPFEIEEDYDLTDKPLLGPWQLFAIIGIIVFATIITFFLKYFTQ